MNNFRIVKAELKDSARIWELLQEGIDQRKKEGSAQWQDGYPNEEVVQQDIESGFGYCVRDQNGGIVGYIAIAEGIDEVYEAIEEKWNSLETYVVLHRLIVDQTNKIPGLGTWILNAVESVIEERGIRSIRVDTNFDNLSMLRVFEKVGYRYCGKIYIRGAERFAFDKIINFVP